MRFGLISHREHENSKTASANLKIREVKISIYFILTLRPPCPTLTSSSWCWRCWHVTCPRRPPSCPHVCWVLTAWRCPAWRPWRTSCLCWTTSWGNSVISSHPWACAARRARRMKIGLGGREATSTRLMSRSRTFSRRPVKG